MDHDHEGRRSRLGLGLLNIEAAEAGCTQLVESLAWQQWLAAARWMWMPVLAFAVTRLGIALVAYVAVPLIADSAPPPYHLRPPDNVLLDVFGSRWDTGFF